VLVDSALEAVSRGSTTIGIKAPTFALTPSHIKPTKPLVEPSEKIFRIDGHVGATGSVYLGDILQLIDEIQLTAQKHSSAVQVDPSGTFFRGGGFAIGQYSNIALDMIQREYNTDMSVEESIRLGNKGIEKALGEKP